MCKGRRPALAAESGSCMTRRCSIAAAQTVPVRGEIDANLERHLSLVDVAAGEGTQVLVFPELSLTGYELDLGESLAFSETDPRLDPLVDAASSHEITLVVGAPVTVTGRLHIGALIISPNRAVSVYTKHHLGAFSNSAAVDGIVPPAERTFFQPGNSNPLVRLGDQIAAVAVCADTGRPSHPQQAADRGARIYLGSMFVIPSEFEAETENLKTAATRHSMTIVFANYGGPSGGLASAGRSSIWSERGELLARLAPTGAGVALATNAGDRWSAKAIII
jgi:predicted amidohydrolase